MLPFVRIFQFSDFQPSSSLAFYLRPWVTSCSPTVLLDCTLSDSFHNIFLRSQLFDRLFPYLILFLVFSSYYFWFISSVFRCVAAGTFVIGIQNQLSFKEFSFWVRVHRSHPLSCTRFAYLFLLIRCFLCFCLNYNTWKLICQPLFRYYFIFFF